MKPQPILFVLALYFTAAVAAESLPAGHPPVDSTRQVRGTPGTHMAQKGKVLSTIDVPHYTYLEVIHNGKTVWIAGPTVAVKKGDIIRFGNGLAMTNFRSKTLNRTFPSISFVDNVVVTKERE